MEILSVHMVSVFFQLTAFSLFLAANGIEIDMELPDVDGALTSTSRLLMISRRLVEAAYKSKSNDNISTALMPAKVLETGLTGIRAFSMNMKLIDVLMSERAELSVTCQHRCAKH